MLSTEARTAGRARSKAQQQQQQRNRATSPSSSPEPDDAQKHLTALPSAIAQIFSASQHSLAVHRKHVVALFNQHASVARLMQETPRGTKLVGEKAFNDAFIPCVNRVLSVKKGETVADRCLKFISAYAHYAQMAFRRQAREEAGTAGDDEDEDDEDDTTATRFVEILLKHCLRGFGAKNKNVRLRCCQLVALLVNNLESLSDDLFETLKSFLLERVNDKESSVRVQAIVAIAKLQQASGDDVEQGEEDEVQDMLVWMLRHDPSAEVRRAALFNLSLTSTTFPHILERLRDVDAINRRCVFLGSLAMLPALLPSAAQVQQASTSSQLLSPKTTSEAIGVGLRDREESVRRATKKLMGTWIDACNGDLEDFLRRFDLLSPSGSGMEVAQQALATMFDAKPALADHVVLVDDAFWNDLTPAKALLAKVLLDHWRDKTRELNRWENAMPPVTALAFRVQKHFNDMIAASEQQQQKRQDQEGDEYAKQERIVLLLLQIALHADYADEIGRRKMFGLLREMMSTHAHASLLSDDLTAACLDLLLKLSNGQRDFMRIVVEITQQLEDDDFSQDEDECVEASQDLVAAPDETTLPVTSNCRMSGSKKRPSKTGVSEEELVERNARRLTIVRGMLERVGGALQENTAFHGLIPQLIAPAVRSKDAWVREQGLTCLGLSCLLDKKLALETFPLFLDQVQRGADGVKLCAVQLVFDLIIAHGIPYLASRTVGSREELGDDEYAVKAKEALGQIMSFLLSLLEDDDEAVQASAALGIAKLMLAGIVDDADDVLKSMVLVYMSPETADNQELRQCLSYFLPAYCYSSPINQRRLQRVWLDTLTVLSDVYTDKDAEQEMVAPQQIALQLIDWMDAGKAIYPGTKDSSINADVLVDILKELVRDQRDERKMFAQLLGKVTLPDELHEAKVNTVLLLCGVLAGLDPFDSTVAANAFARFHAAVEKQYADAAEALDARHCLRAAADGGAAQEPAYIDLQEFFAKLNIDAIKLLSAPTTSKAAASAKRAAPRARAKTAAASSKSAVGTRSRRRGAAAEDEGDETQDDEASSAALQDEENDEADEEEEAQDDFDDL
ncbi:ARM repeat-containing protein [Tilletiaria anomala UBC 951]|uniref:ARM repeat-containing protein n=1 Tax=Tilletiaria anomala (strain ATCC 24038 / CBS 436.72 / UBC 951) TaxID=1037660 RepID=A0A066VF13_TILAU|nr:ARM repeat-containing protein [Tilletiaria anomala UBC 951]KDN38868.1 ARM repeat-containing protein [Tilletiaria anomala UBC 951]